MLKEDMATKRHKNKVLGFVISMSYI